MFDEDLVAGHSIIARRDLERVQLSIQIRLPWYRSLYLSCVESVELVLDGHPVPAEDIFFRLYGTTYPFRSLRDHPQVLWFVLDAAELVVERAPGAIRKNCDVQMTLHLRIPYHRGSLFRQLATCRRSLPLEERIAA